MERPLCTITDCTNLAKRRYKTEKFSKFCGKHERIKYQSLEAKDRRRVTMNDYKRENRKPYTRFKKDYCESIECTATIISKSQLDIHHLDHNHNNNESNNLKTLCANCHRLEHIKYKR